ncbi:complex I 24 kDa subunit family protein [Halarsenatibacter silvermanii]|uniref:NADH-quinone oxidoreductase subunit E n=1 Tax=Halarsenatibacter silvermanii TaxID=321763 RepID=A0A1G9PLI2_9FIRM|nr:NAD(P)H-dependent oxidoreductase subunit E [Halarsenatibacter silvermanii]SDL99640.1 NADH-quinone oxidoreductase subunit E [Halarsenatibacter silvermanii]
MAELAELAADESNLIKALQQEQRENNYISDEAIEEISEKFDMAPVEVEGVVSFYTQFKRVKPGKYKIHVCDGTACHIQGSSLVMGWLSDELGIDVDETDDEKLFTLEAVACLGCCSLAPVMSINGKVYGNLTREKTLDIIEDYRQREASENDSEN